MSAPVLSLTVAVLEILVMMAAEKWKDFLGKSLKEVDKRDEVVLNNMFCLELSPLFYTDYKAV